MREDKEGEEKDEGVQGKTRRREEYTVRQGGEKNKGGQGRTNTREEKGGLDEGSDQLTLLQVEAGGQLGSLRTYPETIELDIRILGREAWRKSYQTQSFSHW